uniref:CCHC-type domain-containing protein n=1 Tax=Anopheles atroparvus TaxID=41427 RepID=A0AAG5DN37_ANOAO
MEEDRTQRVYLFDGTNFSNWSFRMEAYLEELGLLHCIEKTLEEEDFYPINDEDTAAVKRQKEEKRGKRKQQDAKCKSILIQKIADSQLEYVRGKTTPRAIWNTLKQTFEKRGVSGVLYLLKQLATLKYHEKDTIEEHILGFEKIVRELESADVKLDKPVVIFFLLQSMPKSFEQLITVLETLPVEQCTMEFVKARLLSEVMKRQFNGNKPQQENRTPSPGAAYVSNRKYNRFAKQSGAVEQNHFKLKGPKCRRCRKFGHIARECSVNETKQSEAKNSWCTVISSIKGHNDDWFFDSGASNHFTKSAHLLENPQKCEGVVMAANRGEMKIIAKGRINLKPACCP